MRKDMLMIDGLQYVNWNRQLFEEAQKSGVHSIHVTIAYWENIRETLENIGTWNRPPGFNRIVGVGCAVHNYGT